METEITAKLAAHASKLRYEDIPSDVIAKAKDCILDQVGVELIGSTLEWNKIAYRYVTEMGGKPESTIVNYGTKVPSLDAAFVNATFGQGCELDDVGFAAGGHLSAATVPVGLALSEKERARKYGYYELPAPKSVLDYQTMAIEFPGAVLEGLGNNPLEVRVNCRSHGACRKRYSEP